MDVIASYRAMAYLKYLCEYGYRPTLITHPWQNKNGEEIGFEEYDYGRIVRVPITGNLFSKIVRNIESIPLVNKLSIFLRWSLGFFDPHAIDLESYFSLRSFCMDHLRTNSYDLIIGIFSPHHHLKLCYELNRRFGIPYVLDFRDLWDNRIIHVRYKPNFTEGLQDFLNKSYWKKWLKEALFFSITSKPWMEKMKEFTDTEGVVIENGFEEEFFNNFRSNRQMELKQFIVLHTGSLYTHQKLAMFCEGCQKFIQDVKPENFIVKFIGADRKHTVSGLSGFLPNPRNFLRQYLSAKHCEIGKRIAKQDVISEMEKAQLLLFPSFPESPGTYGGKIFDYIASQKPILVVPDDRDVVSELVTNTGTGLIASDTDTVTAILKNLYSMWKVGETPDLEANLEIISKFSRRYLSGKFATYLNDHMR